MRKISGVRVKSLRDQHGLKQKDMADILGVSQAFISALETGTKGLPEELEESLIKEFKLPSTYFDVYIPELATSSFRMPTDTTIPEKHKVASYFSEAQFACREILEAAKFRPFENPVTSDDFETAAIQVREAAGIGLNEPIGNITQVAETFGIGVINILFDDSSEDPLNIDGICNQYEPRPLIVAVREFSGDRYRFTIAHEMAHLMLDPNIQRKRGPKKIESDAHAFAAALLLPADVVKETIDEDTTLDEMLTLKKQFGISVQAIVHRAKAVGVINVARHRELLEELEARKWKLEEPTKIPKEKPRLLGLAAGRVYGMQAYNFLSEKLGISSSRLRDWLGGEEGLGLGPELEDRLSEGFENVVGAGVS